MRILWHRIVAMVLVVIAIVIFVVNRVEIVRFVRSIESIGPGHSPSEVTIGLMAFGLIVVALLGALRIVLNDQNRSQP